MRMSGRSRTKQYGTECRRRTQPYARIELLIRTMLTRTWAPEAWPLLKHELTKALKLRRHIAQAGWWN